MNDPFGAACPRCEHDAGGPYMEEPCRTCREEDGCAYCHQLFDDPSRFHTVWQPGHFFYSAPKADAAVTADRVCTDCVAEAGDELEQCGDCRDYYHSDLDAIHGGLCEACSERRIEEDATEPEDMELFA